MLLHSCLYQSPHDTGCTRRIVCQDYIKKNGCTILDGTITLANILMPCAAGMGMMMMMQMYFTATTHVTLWFQRWHTNSSAWCHPPLPNARSNVASGLISDCMRRRHSVKLILYLQVRTISCRAIPTCAAARIPYQLQSKHWHEGSQAREQHLCRHERDADGRQV